MAMASIMGRNHIGPDHISH